MRSMIAMVLLVGTACGSDRPSRGDGGGARLDGGNPRTSDAATLDGSSRTADGSMRDGAVHDGTLPDGSLPDGGIPDGGMPDGGMTDSSIPFVCPAGFGPAETHVVAENVPRYTTLKAMDVAVTAHDQIVVAGHFGHAIVGGVELMAGSADAFVTMVDPAPGSSWPVAIFGDRIQSVVSIAADADGDILVVGNTERDFTIGDESVSRSGGDDVFVARLAPDGGVRWARAYGGPNDEKVWAASLHPSGALFLVGTFEDSTSLSGEEVTSSGRTDLFVAKLDTGGDVEWVTFAGSHASELAKDIAVDRDMNTFITGTGGPFSVGSDVAEKAFVIKLDSGGAPLWARSVTPVSLAARASFNALAVDTSGDCFLTGSVTGEVLFGDTSFHAAADIVVARFSGEGTLMWVEAAGERISHHHGTDIAIGHDGVYVSAIYSNPFEVGCTSVPNPPDSGGLVAKLGFGGAVHWAQVAVGPGSDAARAIALSPAGRPVCIGDGVGPIDFGGTTAGPEDVQLIYAWRLGDPR